MYVTLCFLDFFLDLYPVTRLIVTKSYVNSALPFGIGIFSDVQIHFKGFVAACP